MYRGDGNNTSDFIVDEALAEGLGRLHSDLVVTRLVKNYTNVARAKGSKFADVVTVPFRGEKSARTKVSGTSFTPSVVSNTTASITIDTHKFYDVLLEDYGALWTQEGLLAGYMTDGASVLAEAVETDVIANYASLSTSVGSAGGGLTDAILRETRKQARTNKFQMNKPTYLVYGVIAEEDLLGIDKHTLVNESGSADALTRAYMGQRYGMDLYTSNLMPAVTGTPTAEHALCFQDEAFGVMFIDMNSESIVPGNDLGVFMQTMQYSDDSGAPIYNMRLIVSYEHKDFGPLLTVDTMYGTSEIRDAVGIDVIV